LSDHVRDLESKYVVQTYRRTPVVLVRGEGVRVFDEDGREYLDLLAGIGVGALGHGHKGLAAAIAEQSREMIHCSNLFFHPLQGQVAERLAKLSGLSRAFFCNSGAEAVEACLKFARRYWYTKGDAARSDILAMEGAFHGRTYGALSVTYDEHYRAPFAPLLPNIRFVPVNNPDALRGAASDRTAAIILEPIQGEGGVRPLTPEFARAVNEVCDKTGALLIADEVQCGLGRTGSPFYFQTLGMKPDLVSVGKALAAGVPMGAALVKDEVAARLSFGDHGSTFGGNLLACRAAIVCLDEIAGGLLDHVKKAGAHLERRLRELAAKHPAIVEVRGAGLMWGLELNSDDSSDSSEIATAVYDAAIRHGLLVNRTAGKVIRLLPPLTITEADLDRALVLLDAAFNEVIGAPSAAAALGTPLAGATT
jgi:acetylornithine aminotransferase/acetylornithine/N-succinyldiaminopimelate aminotransferase